MEKNKNKNKNKKKKKKAVHHKVFTETGNRAWKVAVTQGTRCL